MEQGITASRPMPQAAQPGRAATAGRYMRRNPSLVVGIFLLAILVLFVGIGHLVVDTSKARALSAPAMRAPSYQYPFGTDRQGRDLLAVMVAGTPLTLRIGFIAGVLGVGIGAILGFVSAYYRGIVDTLIRGIADVGLTVPGLLVLIIIAVSIKEGLTVNQMALVVASLAWLSPTRTIRSKTGTTKIRPGPRMPIRRPSRKMTPRWYSVMTLSPRTRITTTKTTTKVKKSMRTFYYFQIPSATWGCARSRHVPKRQANITKPLIRGVLLFFTAKLIDRKTPRWSSPNRSRLWGLCTLLPRF